MAAATVQLDPKDLADFMARVDGKQLRKAVLRGSDVAVGLWVTATKKIMDREEPVFLPGRRKGILRDYRRWAKQMRGRFVGNTVVAQTVAMGGGAAALETGGTYEQWVHGYNRVMTFRGSGGATSRTKHQTVREHKRNRTERRAKHYLGRAGDAIGSIFGVPLERAVEAVFAGGKVPPAQTLKRGLVSGL